VKYYFFKADEKNSSTAIQNLGSASGRDWRNFRLVGLDPDFGERLWQGSD